MKNLIAKGSPLKFDSLSTVVQKLLYKAAEV